MGSELLHEIMANISGAMCVQVACVCVGVSRYCRSCTIPISNHFLLASFRFNHEYIAYGVNMVR